MNTNDIRLERLLQLIQEHGQTKVANLVGIESSYISQLKNPNNPKKIGEKLARRVEDAFHLPHGWMDVLHDNEAMRVINGDPMLPPSRLDDRTPEELLKIIVAYEEGSELKQLALQKLSQLPEDKLNAILSLIG